MSEPKILQHGFFGVQACVPGGWSDEQIEAWASDAARQPALKELVGREAQFPRAIAAINSQHCVVRAGGAGLGRVQCAEHVDNVHVVLDFTFTNASDH